MSDVFAKHAQGVRERNQTDRTSDFKPGRDVGVRENAAGWTSECLYLDQKLRVEKDS